MKIAVVAIIEKDGQVLIGRKIKKEGHVFSEAWHLPGGGVEPNETEESALVREMKEETGLIVRIEKLLVTSELPEHDLTMKWYLCSALTHDLKPGDDLAEAKFVSKSTALRMLHPTAISVWPMEVSEYMRN